MGSGALARRRRERNRERQLAAFIAALLIGLTMAAPAQALIVTGSPHDVARIGRLIEQMRVPAPPHQEILVAPCPGYIDVAGCTWTTPSAPIYIAPGDVFWPELYHELGHKFAALMPPGAILAFGTLTHRRAVARDDERLADAYMLCARGLMPHGRPAEDPDWVSGYGYEPTRREHRRVCAMLTHAAVEMGLGGAR